MLIVVQDLYATKDSLVGINVKSVHKYNKMSSSSEHDSFGEDYDYNEEDFDVEVADEGATASADRLEVDSGEEEYQPYSGEPIADEEWLVEYNQRTARAEEQLTVLNSRLDGSVPVSSW